MKRAVRLRVFATLVAAGTLSALSFVPSSAHDEPDEPTSNSQTKSQGKKHGHDRPRKKPKPVDRTCASDKTKEYTANVAALPFEAIPGSKTTRQWGVLDDAGYRIEIPENWNGELVMWAHGFAGWGCDLNVDNPPMRKYLVENGFAWAASSYALNGYAVQAGVDDTMNLVNMFAEDIADPKAIYMTGASMGGHITGVAIEQHPQTFRGSMPVCGVMGSGKLFDFFIDANELAIAISGVSAEYPYPATYNPVTVPAIKAALGGPTSPKLQAFAAALMQRSGGTRPGFPIALGAWLDFLFGLGQPSPGIPAFPATNFGTVYQLDDDPAVSEQEAALNASVRRVSRFDFDTPDGKVKIPRIFGYASVPTLTMHTIGDLFVPFSMQQIYLQRATKTGTTGNLVQRAIRDVGHCSFSEAEFNRGFADLITWVKTGTRPAGDAVGDPSVVADPFFGCQFSDNTGIFAGTPARAAFAPCKA
jgi:pimeloyl-ACP methyl ester carboxylesterase